MKKAWSWLVAAFKKLIQSVSNFIRGVMNFVGGIVAKTQSGLVDKYKNIAPKDGDKTGKLIKAMKPKKGLAGIIANFNKNIASAVNSLNTDFEKIQKDSMIGTGATISNALNAETSKKISELLDARSEAGLEGANPSKRAKEIVFGNALVTQYYPAQLLSDGEWKTVLSKDFLGKMKEFVSDGKKLIKMFQNCLKQIEAIQKQVVNVQNAELNAKKEGATKAQKQSINNQKKSVANQMKKTRSAISEITHYRNFSGKMTGVLYGIYANCLKARSYYASAVRSYAAAVAKPTKGNKKAKEEAAFQKRTGVNA